MATTVSPISSIDTTENTETKILTIMKEVYPDLDCGPGTPVYEMVVRPMAYLWSRQNMGIEELIKSVGFNDYLNMAQEDMDRLMSRYFLTRRTGEYVQGTVRCTTRGDKDVFIYAGEVWETEDARTYSVNENHTIREEDWDDMAEDGSPLHWTTKRTDVIICLGHVENKQELYLKEYPQDGDTWIVDSEKYAYKYDSSIEPKENEDPSVKWVKIEDKPNPIMYKEVPVSDREYYIDVGVTSTGIGQEFNTAEKDAINPTGSSASNIVAAYFLSANVNGGSTETNYEFYTRAKNELGFRGLCSYNSTAAILSENFPHIKEVVSIGLRDPEMLRDKYLVEVHQGELITHEEIHVGGHCDIYIKPNNYFTESGYTAPLGFPMEYNGYKLSGADDMLLLQTWNNSVNGETDGIALEDSNKRGSVLESISPLTTTTKMVNLKSDIKDIHEFCTNGKNASIHTDMLVKQMWPIIVKMEITIESDKPDADISIAKSVLSLYINSLTSSTAPQTAEVAHLLRSVGIQTVRMPMHMRAFYLKDDLHMEYIGLNKERYPLKDSLLNPLTDDSLAFEINANNTSQISLRTCSWYTNPDLIEIKVVPTNAEV